MTRIGQVIAYLGNILRELESILIEAWDRSRLIIVRLVTNFFISVALWILTFLFNLITIILPIEGRAADLFAAIVSAGTLGALLVFVVLSVIDLWAMKRNGGFYGICALAT